MTAMRTRPFPRPRAACHGEPMNDVQKLVQETIDRLVESGDERGLQVSVYRHGEQIVDAVAGLADPVAGRTVTPGTPFYCFSVVKAATSTIVHMLVERGLFGYDTPVAQLWPEFGAHGKERVTVRQVLNHTAGVPGVPQDTTLADLCDWDTMCAAVADAHPWWEPGTKIGYHAITFGYILGEVVRLTTGKRISQVLREEVAEPLGVADELYFGMPASEHHRLARLEDLPGTSEQMTMLPPDLPMFRAAPAALFPTAEWDRRPDILSADIPAGGKATARAAARLYAALLGEVDGVRLLSPESLRLAAETSATGVDEVFGFPTTWGLGFSVGMPGFAAPTLFGVGGVGGSYAGGDVGSGVAFAITKNRLRPDFDSTGAVLRVVLEATAG